MAGGCPFLLSNYPCCPVLVLSGSSCYISNLLFLSNDLALVSLEHKQHSNVLLYILPREYRVPYIHLSWCCISHTRISVSFQEGLFFLSSLRLCNWSWLVTDSNWKCIHQPLLYWSIDVKYCYSYKIISSTFTVGFSISHVTLFLFTLSTGAIKTISATPLFNIYQFAWRCFQLC